MKAFQKIIFFSCFFFLFPIFTLAITTEEASEKMADYILDSFESQDWSILNNKNNAEFYDMKIYIGTTDDSGFNEVYKNINGASVLLLNCGGHTDYKECDRNIEGYANFRLTKENNQVYLISNLISQSILDNLRSADSYYYVLSVSRKGLFKGKLEEEGTFDNPKKENFDQADMDEGRIANPKVIGLNGEITVPIKDASFWENAGSNKCYYFRFDYSSKSSTKIARYKITYNGTGIIQNHIFWANDPNYTLASTLVGDVEIEDVYGVSSSNVYAICNAYGTVFNFSYYDSKPLVVGNHLQQQEVTNQNGEGSSTLYDDEQEVPEEEEDLCENGNCDISLSGLCNQPKVARTLKFLGIVLFIIKIFVPFLIIVLGSVDFAKAMIDGKQDEIPKKIPVLIKRLIAGIVIFLIPSIINFLFSVIDTYSETMEKYDNCRVCIFEPDNCDVRD